jgi:hypothetical protein
MTFPDGTTRVWVMPVATSDDAAPDVEARIEAAGFAPDSRRAIWTLVAAYARQTASPKKLTKLASTPG